MINNEMISVVVKEFVTGTDSYGQTRQGTAAERNVDMMLKLYSHFNNHSNTSDVRYVDVEMIGLTSDKTITDKNVIVAAAHTYNVLFVNNAGRLAQIFLKEV